MKGLLEKPDKLMIVALYAKDKAKEACVKHSITVYAKIK